MQKALRVLFMSVALCCVAAPAWACINDRETQKQEQQFRSLYPDAPSQPAPSDPDHTLAYGGSGLGIVMLGVAGYFGLGRRRS